MQASMHLAASSTLLALATTSFAQTKTWVVDDVLGPGVDFIEVQPAVDAASAGDVILVRPGSFGGFALQGKGLVITADAGQKPVIGGPPIATRVEQVPAGEAVVLRGLQFQGELAFA